MKWASPGVLECVVIVFFHPSNCARRVPTSSREGPLLARQAVLRIAQLNDGNGSSAVARAAILKVGRPTGGSLRGRELHYEAVAPAVLGNKERLHSAAS
jgi:hypothetical protein